MPAFDPSAGAKALAEAYDNRRQIASLPEGARPATLDDGYAIQDRIAAEASRPGGISDTIAGWKLGLGSANAMKGASLARPVIGRVFTSRLYKPGSTVPMNAGPALMEFEIAFKLARDVKPGEKIADPLDAVESVHVACEIVLSRFADRKTVGLPSFVADSVGFHALVVGPPVPKSAIGQITRTGKVAVDGKETAGAQTGDDAIDPVWSLGQLMAHARDRGLTLRKGEIVTTGTMTRPFEQAAPAKFTFTADGAELTLAIAAD